MTVAFYGTLDEYEACRNELVKAELDAVYLGEIGSDKIKTPAVRTRVNFYWGGNFYQFIAQRSASGKTRA